MVVGLFVSRVGIGGDREQAVNITRSCIQDETEFLARRSTSRGTVRYFPVLENMYAPSGPQAAKRRKYRLDPETPETAPVETEPQSGARTTGP